MKPTLAQLKKRPALWVFASNEHYAEPRITMPDGTMWAYGGYWHPNDWWRKNHNYWHKFSIEYYDFAGWL